MYASSVALRYSTLWDRSSKNICLHAGTTNLADLSRKMQFSRPTIKASEPVVDVKLVINLPSGFTQSGEVTLYKSSSDNPEHTQLDRVSMPSCSTTCWFQLTVGLDNLRDSMKFLIRFNHGDGNFIEDINPMIVLYTNRDQSEAMSNMFAQESRNSQAKRQAVDADTPTPTPPPNMPLSQLKMRNRPCRKETAYLTYSQLRWLDEDINLIAPTYISFDFCYGSCNLRFDMNPLDIPADRYNRRTRVLQAINQLGGGTVLPQSCCVPTSYTAKEIIYASGDLVTMTTLPSVHSCGCRM